MNHRLLWSCLDAFIIRSQRSKLQTWFGPKQCLPLSPPFPFTRHFPSPSDKKRLQRVITRIFCLVWFPIKQEFPILCTGNREKEGKREFAAVYRAQQPCEVCCSPTRAITCYLRWTDLRQVVEFVPYQDCRCLHPKGISSFLKTRSIFLPRVCAVPGPP